MVSFAGTKENDQSGHECEANPAEKGTHNGSQSMRPPGGGARGKRRGRNIQRPTSNVQRRIRSNKPGYRRRKGAGFPLFTLDVGRWALDVLAIAWLAKNGRHSDQRLPTTFSARL